MHFELTYKKKGANRKKNNKSQGNLPAVISDQTSNDDIQYQLTRYFSTLPLSSTGPSGQQDALNSRFRIDSRGANFEINDETQMMTADKSVSRRRSYPHEDINTSKMLKSLFGSDGSGGGMRLSDPFPAVEGFDTVSHLIDEDIFGKKFDFEIKNDSWNHGNVSGISDGIDRFGLPNPQAPVFIPQKSRF